MKTIIPISLKIGPDIRQRLKAVAYRMDWSEHQFAKNLLEAALDLVDRRDSMPLDRLVRLARAGDEIPPEKRSEPVISQNS